MEDQTLSTILLKGKALIGVTLVATVALAIVATKLSEKVYQATAVIQVSSANLPESGVESLLTEQQASQGLAKQYASLLGSRSFLERMRSQVPGRPSAASLQSRLRATAIKDTGLVELVVEGPSPEDTRRIADSIAAAFLDTVRDDANNRTVAQQQQIQDQVARLTDRIERLERSGRAETPTTSEQIASLRKGRNGLAAQMADVAANNIARGGSVSLAASPVAEPNPVRPRPALNVIAGVLLGLLLGVSFAWLRTRLDTSLHSSEEAEQLLGVPVLASIPLTKRFSPREPVLAEAFEVLRANIGLRDEQEAVRVLTVASYSAGEGKTSVIAGLAFAAVSGGRRLLVIDGDLRKRTLSAELGHADSDGLTDLIMGDHKRDSIREVAPGLSLLPAGTGTPSPPSLLYGSRMRQILSRLRDEHELIIIDSPPAAHLADAAILASLSDGVVIVSRVGVTKRKDLESVALSLGHSRTPIVGVVVLEHRTVDGTYAPGAHAAEPFAPTPAASS